MQVAVIKDVKHKSPWIPPMSAEMPAGHLVLVESKSKYVAYVYACTRNMDRGWTWAVSPRSIEILGDL